MKKFIIGCLLGTVVVGAGAIFVIKKIENRPVMFASKRVFKHSESLVFEGSIYGDGDENDRPINNYIRGVCSKEAMSCELQTMDEINGYVGAMWTETIPIRSWDDNQLVADSKGLSSIKEQCSWYKIAVDLRTEHIDYIRYPNEHAKQECQKYATEKVFRWRVDNGPAWLENADKTTRN
jgi:hypothetical protein